MHRFWRSEEEYLALLYRGANTESSNYAGIKTNRDGFRFDGKDLVKVSPPRVKQEHQSYEAFLDECELRDDLLEARRQVLQRSERLVEKIAEIRDARSAIMRVLVGTGLSINLVDV